MIRDLARGNHLVTPVAFLIKTSAVHDLETEMEQTAESLPPPSNPLVLLDPNQSPNERHHPQKHGFSEPRNHIASMCASIASCGESWGEGSARCHLGCSGDRPTPQSFSMMSVLGLSHCLTNNSALSKDSSSQRIKSLPSPHLH